MERFKRVYIEITNKCNLNCKFCPKSNRKLEDMSVQNFELVLKKLQGYCKYIYLHVKGEPLLHSNLKTILQKALTYNMNVIITTNGTLIKKNLEILKNSKAISQINISAHSIEQNEMKTNLRDYLSEIIDCANEINKSSNVYISYRLWNMDDDNNLEKDKNILEILSKKYNVKDIFKDLENSSYLKLSEKVYINLDNIFEWPDLNKNVISTTGNCYGLINQLAILVDGTVVPCCLDQNGDIPLGNIFESSMQDILNNELSKKIMTGFKENKLIHPLCQKCGFRVFKRK